MRIRSIGSKLTLWYTGLLSITFLLLGTIAYGLLAYSLAHDMDYALKNMAEVIVERTRTKGQPFYPEEVDELFRRFFGFSPLHRQFDILDPKVPSNPATKEPRSQQIPISRESLEKAARGEAIFETVVLSDSYPIRILTVPVLERGHLVNMVRVGMSLENMYKTRKRFLLIMAAMLPVGVLLAGGGGWLLARRALRPVDQMTEIARKISGQHLDQRLQESGNGDELDRLAKTLNNMLNRLNDAFEQMRQFSADASHELQTPLTILKGEMEVALRKERTCEEYQDILGSGLEEINRINHLVEGLLLLARADSGVLGLDFQPVELEAFTTDLLRQIEPLADQRKIILNLICSGPVTVEADRDHLRRLLVNLLSNALKYSREGGKVTTKLFREKEWAVLQVCDTGIGIDESEQQRIFNRFYRATVTGSRDGRGVGLGLSIAQSIVKAHNGYIEVDSTPEQGSIFSVHLPALSD